MHLRCSQVCLTLGCLAVGCSGGGGSASAPGSADGGDAGLVHIDRSHLADAGTSGTLDYSDPALWVCRPGIDPNACYSNLDATQILVDGGRRVVPHERATNPEFDCFYVYPTVDLTSNGNMTNLSDVSLVLDPLLSQAARFSRMCEVYAPLYRQVAFTPTSIGGTPGGDAGPSDAGADGASAGLLGGPNAALALGDVRAAFQYYLAHYNHGRKFVIMGHSQGSGMLGAMMQTDVDPVPSVRAQMISAVLLGGGLTVAPGMTSGGSFKNIPLCQHATDTGCLVAYSSFDVASPPGPGALFGMSPDGNQVACNNPSTLAGNAGPYAGTYFPIKVNNPLFIPDTLPPTGITTPFVLWTDVFSGQCVVKNGYSYLEVTFLEQAGDPRGIPPYNNSGSESLGFGLHLADYNIPLEDLLDLVQKQAAAALGH